jgi:hypothetical protein
MKSLPMVARTEVLQRNIPEDWSVKDRTSCKKNIHLGHEDYIIKIVQMEEAHCINTWGPTGAKGWPNRASTGLGLSAQAFRPGPLRGSVLPPFLAPEGPSTLSSWRRRHSQDKELFTPRGHPQVRDIERGWRWFGRRIAQLERSTQVEKKEDTVGSVTMINGAMSSTLMG